MKMKEKEKENNRIWEMEFAMYNGIISINSE